MKKFLLQISKGLAMVACGFVLVAAIGREVPLVNWFFFQKNEHRAAFYTIMNLEQMLADGDSVDVLILGSSACEYALDPHIIERETGLRTFKLATGGQTIDMSAHLARHLAPKLKTKYLVIDAYPRIGSGLTEEGVERAILNTPDASSELALTILAAHPYSGTTNYLWAARAIGTMIAPYPLESMEVNDSYTIQAPGYSNQVKDPATPPGEFYALPLKNDAIAYMNRLNQDLSHKGIEMLAILPAIQNATIVLDGKPSFPVLKPSPRADTCFFDAIHMRKVCVPDYSLEIASLLLQYHQDRVVDGALHSSKAPSGSPSSKNRVPI